LCLDTRCAYYDKSRFWRGALGHCIKTTGDVCHVVPHGRRCVAAFSADTPPALVACGARVRLVSRAGERTMALTDLYTSDGARNTVLRPGEIVVDASCASGPP
jgi:4-hydroxybenzoyl-CoA reductase subunit beta